MDQTERAVTAPSAADLERAIASVPGVAEATVGRSTTTGRSRLRIRLVPGQAPETVSWAVAATLRERFGILLDPAEIRPRPTVDDTTPEPDGARHDDGADRPSDGHAHPPDIAPLDVAITADRLGAAAPCRSPDRRAAIRHLDTRRAERDVEVTATLEHAGRAAEGHAAALPTSHGVLRAVAEATLDALRGLTEGAVVAGVDQVSVSPTVPTIATVVVTLLAERGEEILLGASVVRGDPERAVMRATLDALNRRVAAALDEVDAVPLVG